MVKATGGVAKSTVQKIITPAHVASFDDIDNPAWIATDLRGFAVDQIWSPRGQNRLYRITAVTAEGCHLIELNMGMGKPDEVVIATESMKLWSHLKGTPPQRVVGDVGRVI